jgi:hypothetical protein
MRLSGAMSCAYPAMTSRACLARRRFSARPRTTHTGSPKSITVLSAGPASTAAGSVRSAATALRALVSGQQGAVAHVHRGPRPRHMEDPAMVAGRRRPTLNSRE